MKHKLFVFPLLCIILLPIFLTGCSKQQEAYSNTSFYFNTAVTLTVYDTSSIHAEKILKESFSLCETYENLFSRTKEGSDVWNINHSGGQPVTVSSHTISLLQTAIHYSELTHGAIDPTIAPLEDIWQFTSSPSVPSQEALNELLPHIDYNAIVINEKDSTVMITDSAASIDLGFIAKGYIADRIKEYMVEEKVSSAIINLGGNVLTVGKKPDSTPFTIGIQKPFDERNTAFITVSATDSSVVSSGIYERYFEQDGRLYHHILNPSTGQPVENNLFSVTILSDSSLEGDALSTTCFILGLEEGQRLIQQLPDVEAIFITDTYDIYDTRELN